MNTHKKTRPTVALSAALLAAAAMLAGVATALGAVVSSNPVTVALPSAATETAIVTAEAPAVIDNFSIDHPMTPWATISADPQAGTESDYSPITTITWSTDNADSVTVSGTNIQSTEANGTQSVTGLMAGSHTYTVTAYPRPYATISWQTSNAHSLILVTPFGDIDVTYQNEYTVDAAGDYTLNAINAIGAVVSSNPVTVDIPSEVTETVTVDVYPAAVIDSFSIDHPWPPTATISADPQTGTESDYSPITTITWSTDNADSVTVSGTNIQSTEANGTQSVTGLMAGSHTYTVTAYPRPYATISWQTSNAHSLILVTPFGDIDVTYQNEYTVDAAGDYTLNAINAIGTVVSSNPVTVDIPSEVTETVTVDVYPAAVIDNFSVTNPSAPTATISANPQTGTAPLNSSITWSTSNAASVAVSGNGLNSTDASGNQSVNGLTAGTHTYTVTTQPQTTATISWNTSDASTLTLVTPSGNVTVTGQTSYTATEAGSYTLKAANALGAVVNSDPVTVTLPSAATETATVTVTAPASIDSFSVSNPSVPTATISASPQTGNAPFDTTITWSAGNAASVTVSGPGVSSTDASGTQSVTGLTQGTHTYTVIAQPQTSATITWSTTGATTLTLVTPSGDVTVTGQTSYAATEAGSYTLKAANALGAVVSSSPATVNLPSTKTESVTITVNEQLPTIPAVIDNDTVIVAADPTNPGGIIIDAGILADPSDPDQSQVFEEDKITLFTATDILGTWSVADRSTYTIQIASDGLSFTIVIAPTADTARFYRVATTLEEVDVAGAPVAGDTVKYNTTLFGQYKVTIPAGGEKLIAHQLINSDKTTVAQLFSALPNRSSVMVQDSETGAMYSAAKNAMGIWNANGARVVPLGYAVVATNGSTALPVTLEFTGIVPDGAQTYHAVQGQPLYMGAHYPVFVSSVETELGYVRDRNNARYDIFAKLVDAVYNNYPLNSMGNWSSGQPTFGIGEGFIFNEGSSAESTWVQPALVIREDNRDVQTEQ